jgi:putative transcriptional regulator
MKKVHCKLAVLMAEKDPRLSQKRLAEETGLGMMTVRRLFLNDFTRVDTHTIEELCKYFNCEVGDLFELREVKSV